MADAEAVVRRLMARVVAERGLAGPVEIRALSSGGGNYTSALFAGSAGDLKVFAKVAIIGEKMRKVMNAETLFKTEQTVYLELVKTYNDIMVKHELAGLFRFPKIYATLPDLGSESLVMEDLSEQGYQVPLRHEPISWRFASAAVAKLAAFHALSFAYEIEQPEEFAAMSARHKYQPQERKPENEKEMKAAWEGMMKGAIDVVKGEHRSKLKKVLVDLEGFTKFKTPIGKTVLAHGDYRASNLMFKEQDGSLDIMVVDYQMLHAGSPVSDLMYFIFLGTDQEFRRTRYQDLLGVYHRELSVALDGLGLDVGEVYPEEMFQEEVKQILPYALQMAVVILPIVMVDEAAAPQVSGDADIQHFAIEPSKLFAERFTGLVQDCADWGVI